MLSQRFRVLGTTSEFYRKKLGGNIQLGAREKYWVGVNFIQVQFYRDQLLKFRVSRALRTMKAWPNFPSEFYAFVQDEARSEATAILSEKDQPRPQFNLENLRKFSYKAQLDKFQRTNPLLLSVIIGTLSKGRVPASDIDEISRKGFGGPVSSADITLVPTGKQL